MITKIEHVTFVRSIKTKKSEQYPLGLKAKTTKNGQNYVWEEGLFIEKNDGMPDENGCTGIILDGNLNIVSPNPWDVHNYNELTIGNLKIGKLRHNKSKNKAVESSKIAIEPQK